MIEDSSAQSEREIRANRRTARIIGPLSTLLLVGAVSLLGSAGIIVPSPGVLIIAVVIYSAFAGGLGPGLISAAISVAYMAQALRLPGPGLHYSSNGLGHLVATALIMPGVATLIAFLKARLDAIIARERELRRIAEAAHAEISFQAGLLDAVAQAVLAVDLAGNISYMNRNAEKTYGWTAAEAIGQPIAELLLPEESREQGKRAVARLLDGESWSGDMIVRRKNGTRFNALVVASPIRDAKGQPRGGVTVSSDLTERLRAAHEQKFLAEAGQVLSSSLDVQTTLESVAKLAVPFLADFCLVDVLNDGELNRVGVAHVRHDLANVANALRDFPPDAQGDSAVANVVRSGAPFIVDSIPQAAIHTLDRAYRDLIVQLGPRSCMIVPIMARGAVVGTISFVSSTDEHRYGEADLALAEELARRAGVALDNARLYHEAQAANQAKSDFLAVVSHELRTPLTTIMGYTDLLLTGVPEPLPKTAGTYVDRVRKAAWHLLGLIEQILIYARMEVGRDEVHPSRVELAELTRETAVLMEPIAAEKGLQFLINAPSPPAVIETDLTKIRQILLNLLSNAVKFTEKGEIRLDVALKDGKAVFRVTDSGQGISSEHLEKIFDPFWQVEHATTRSVGGAGLGLSVTRRLARLLGGDVRVLSAPGAGSSFVVELPVRYEPPPKKS
jgi:PAS domain S-box-containing protein